MPLSRITGTAEPVKNTTTRCADPWRSLNRRGTVPNPDAVASTARGGDPRRHQTSWSKKLGSARLLYPNTDAVRFHAAYSIQRSRQILIVRLVGMPRHELGYQPRRLRCMRFQEEVAGVEDVRLHPRQRPHPRKRLGDFEVGVVAPPQSIRRTAAEPTGSRRSCRTVPRDGRSRRSAHAGCSFGLVGT